MNKHQVLATLQEHQGKENGITAHKLALQVFLTERKLRKIISQLREDGVAICGHPSTGYFIAATSEELDTTCEFLRNRAMHSLTLEAKLRQIPLPDLLGQLRLPT